MMQKNSSCKLHTLIRRCCGRNAALFTVSLLVFIMALPVRIIMTIQGELLYMLEGDDLARTYIIERLQSSLQADALEVIALIFMGVLTGIAMFRYLHVKKQTDFFHALPITRGQLFLSHFLTGLLIVIPAYLVSVILSCCVCAAYGFGEAVVPSMMVLSVLLHLAGFLLVYVVSILSAILSGNTIVSILVCGWLQLGFYVGCLAVDELLYVLYPARENLSYGRFYWLSPVAQAMHMRNQMSDLLLGSAAECWKACALTLLLVTAASVVIVALSYWLNAIRKSEHTGMSIAFPKIELPFKLYMVTVMAILFGLIFEVTSDSWTTLFVTMAIGGVITACFIEIVYNQDFRSLFRRWKSLLVYYIIAAVVLTGMALDVTKYNSRLPDRNDIVSATLSGCGMEAWDCMPKDSDDSIVYFHHGNIINSAVGNYYQPYSYVDDMESSIDYLKDCFLGSKDAVDIIYSSASIGAEAMKHNRSRIHQNGSQYLVRFRLQNGKIFSRQYFMPDDTVQLVKNASAVRFSEEYLSRFTQPAIAYENKENVKSLLVMNYEQISFGGANEIDNPKRIAAILDTLYEESKKITKDYAADHLPVLLIRACGEQAMENWSTYELRDVSTGNSPYDDIVNIPVYSCETETLKLLQEYIDNLTTGFDSITDYTMHITVFTEEEEEMPKQVFYSSQSEADMEHIKLWLPQIMPYNLDGIVDAVYYHPEENGIYRDSKSSVDLQCADGMVLSCSSYRDVEPEAFEDTELFTYIDEDALREDTVE